MSIEKNNDVRNFFLGLIGLIVFLILMIKGVEEYANYSFKQEMKDEPQLQKEVVKKVDYQDIKNRVEQMGIELEKIIKTKDINVKQKKSIKFVLVDKYYCDKWDNENRDCYINVKEKMIPFGLLFKDKNISKLFSSEQSEELLIQSQEKKNITIPRENNRKDEVYLTILSEYKSLFNNYIEHIEICKKMDIEYKQKRENKDLNKRVILKQNKNLIDCYETVELTSEELESITEDLAKNYSKRIKKDTESMMKNFSENKNMVKKNLINLRTKIN